MDTDVCQTIQETVLDGGNKSEPQDPAVFETPGISPGIPKQPTLNTPQQLEIRGSNPNNDR